MGRVGSSFRSKGSRCYFIVSWGGDRKRYSLQAEYVSQAELTNESTHLYSQEMWCASLKAVLCSAAKVRRLEKLFYWGFAVNAIGWSLPIVGSCFDRHASDGWVEQHNLFHEGAFFVRRAIGRFVTSGSIYEM